MCSLVVLQLLDKEAESREQLVREKTQLEARLAERSSDDQALKLQLKRSVYLD